MIAANELRVGNWIRWKSTGAIERVYNIITNTKWHSGNDVDLNDAEPIEITEDILLNAGFVQVEMQFWKDYMFLQKIGGDWTFGQTPEYDESGHITTIWYVHQLQNIWFALTGEELKLEL